MMKTKRRRHVSVLLPNKQHLDCSVSVRARGQEVMNSVLRQLGVSDLQVFGLSVLRDNEYLFLDLTKKLSKYFGKRWNRGSLRVPFILFLRIQFYVGSGLLILSSKVQQLYFTELRHKVLRSQSCHQEALLFQLAASALQAEVGDQELSEGTDNEGREAEQERKHYFLPEDYFPFWLIKRRGRDYLLRHSPALHSELRGLSQSRAVLQFIKESSRLQDGAVTFYRMKQDKKEKRSSILLGVAGTGVHVYLDVEGKHCAMFDFSWTDIDHLTFQGCRFEIGVVASLGLPKLVYYTCSAFHSEHILRHLRNTHQFHISTRAAAGCVQQLEDLQASCFHKEAYICDVAGLRQSLSCSYLTSSTSDCSAAVETVTVWTEEEEEGSSTEVELSVDEPEEVFVDNPDEVPWLAEMLHSVSVDEPLMVPSSSWAAITMEMKQVLWRRTGERASAD